MRNDHDRTARRLTHDELKAAEAAFQGREFNAAWSQAGRMVYDGILSAKRKLNDERLTRGVLASNYHEHDGSAQYGSTIRSLKLGGKWEPSVVTTMKCHRGTRARCGECRVTAARKQAPHNVTLWAP